MLGLEQVGVVNLEGYRRVSTMLRLDPAQALVLVLRLGLGLKLVLLVYYARTKCILITIHSPDDVLNSVYTVDNETYIRMLESFALSLAY